MTDYIREHRVLFPELVQKPLEAVFDQPHSSSDGGGILLKAADKALGLTKRLAAGLLDRRDPGKVRHQLVDLLRQRIFGIACGYADCNDAARLADDPIHKLLLDRHPVSGPRLSSQSTLCRFENAIGRAELYRMGTSLAEVVIERQKQRLKSRVRKVTIDLDPTDVETHGEQQLAMFNGFYREWCYLPTLGFLTFNDEPEQYAFAALLRPGKASTTQGAIGLLRRTIARLREAFPQARIQVRLDGGFASTDVFDFLDGEEVEYVIAMAENAVLKEKAAKLMEKTRKLSEESGESAQLYGSFLYAAQTWGDERRVVVKAEVVRLEGRDPRDNPRFVVTNMPHDPEELYAVIYCGRGEIENRLKEAKELRLDRASCSKFWANQLRMLLALGALVLMQEIRTRAARTGLGRAQVATMRERLFKLAGHVVSSVRRFVLHLPQNCPWRLTWMQVAESFTGPSG